MERKTDERTIVKILNVILKAKKSHKTFQFVLFNSGVLFGHIVFELMLCILFCLSIAIVIMLCKR